MAPSGPRQEAKLVVCLYKMLTTSLTVLPDFWFRKISPLGPYLVIISFSSTARILLKLPHGKPLCTLRMLRRTRDTKLL